MYQYRVERVTRIPAGDQVDVIVDLGFHMSAKVHIILEGIECPEIGEFEDGRDVGLAARDFVVQWFREKPQPWTVISRKAVKGQRNTWVATILDSTGGSLSDALVSGGHATNPEN
jgi:endonuclease YncB( thermonuclease family)